MAIQVTGTGVTVGTGLGPISDNYSDSNFRLILYTQSEIKNGKVVISGDVCIQTYRDSGTYYWKDTNNSLSVSFNGASLVSGQSSSINTDGSSAHGYSNCQVLYTIPEQTISKSGSYNLTATFNRGAGDTTGSDLYPTVTQTITVTGVQTAPTNLQLINNGDNTYTPKATLGDSSTGIHFYYYFGDGTHNIVDYTSGNVSNHNGVSVAGSSGEGTPIKIYNGVKKVFVRAWTIPNESGLWSSETFDVEYVKKQPTFNVTQEGKNIRVEWVSGEHFDCNQLIIQVSVDEGTSVDYSPDYHNSNSFEFTPEGATNNSSIAVTGRFYYMNCVYSSTTQKMELTGTRYEDYSQTITYESSSLQVYICKGNNWVPGRMYVCKSNSWKSPTQVKVCKNSTWK